MFVEFMLEVILEALKHSTTPYVAPEVKKILLGLKGEMTRKEIQAKLGLKDEKHFRETYQQPTTAAGLVEMTVPDKPRSRLQKYRITSRGLSFIKSLS